MRVWGACVCLCVLMREFVTEHCKMGHAKVLCFVNSLSLVEAQNAVLNTVFKEHKSQERRRPQCSLFVCFRDNLPTDEAQHYTPSRGPCVPVARLLLA
jgi:hypothetical protein